MESGETHDVAEAQSLSEPEGARPGQHSCDGRAPILTTHALTKQFGNLRAVDGLDMEVCKGDIFGFLGPNGAGKTTVIRLVLGLIHPTSGHAEVCGHRVPGELQGALRHVGGFVDDPTFYPLMSARRNLRLLGSMTGPVSEERIDEVLEIVALDDRAEDRVGGFSHGMKQRLGIAQALLHSPELIVLDEPTSGLDPRGMKDVRELIRELGAAGTTVFLSSHLLHEVEQVCTRAVIINKGRVVVQGPVSELRPQNDAIKVLTGDQGRAGDVLRGQFGAGGVIEDEGFLVVKADEDAVPEMVRRLVADGVEVRAVVPASEQGLEDFFLELTVRRRRAARQEARRPRAAAPGRPAMSPGGCACPPPAAAGARPAPRRPPAPADAAHGSTTAGMRGHAWGALRREWIKLLFQRRSYLIWGGAFVIPFLIALAFYLTRNNPESGGGGGPVFMERITSNGMFVTLASLTVLIPFLLPMAAAMVAGYMIAGEAELGTLRIVLLRPTRRGAFVLAKWTMAMVYLAVGFGLMLAGGLLFGGIFFGLHPMITLSGSTVGVWHGLGLILLSCLYSLAAMACIVSMALLFSSLTDSSLTALIATIVIYIVITVLIQFSYFDWLRPWVFPQYLLEFTNFFRDPIYWRPILKGLGVFALWSGVLTAAAYLVFRRKDVLS